MDMDAKMDADTNTNKDKYLHRHRQGHGYGHYRQTYSAILPYNCSKMALTGETQFNCEFVDPWDMNR